MLMEENIKLGGNIELSGFNSLNGGEMIVVKKIVGNYVRRMEGMCKNFGGVKLTLKPVHGEARKFEVHGQLVDNGQVFPASLVDRNVFVGVDAVMKKLVNGIS